MSRPLAKEKPDFKNTLGVYGSNPIKIAAFYRQFVEYCCNTHKIQKDQDHPPAVVCYTRVEAKISQNLCRELGAEILINVDELEQDEYGNFLSRDLNEKFQQTLQDLSTEDKKLQYKHVDKHIRLGGFSYLGEKSAWPNTAKALNSAVLATRIEIGIIGGAGTLTGAHFCQELAKGDNPPTFLMLSDTTAPDKNNAMMPSGEDFVPNYVRRVTTLEKVIHPTYGVVAIPCNTAHIKKGKFCGDMLDEINSSGDVVRYAKFVDIGYATLDDLRKKGEKKVILLGTPATIKNEKSAFSEDRLHNAGIEALKPNDEEIMAIYEAIYKIKGFRSSRIIDHHRSLQDIADLSPQLTNGERNITLNELTRQAKALIIGAIESIRKRIGDSENEIPAILGCTELPIVFSDQELLSLNLISTTRCLAQSCAQKVNERKLTTQKGQSDLDDEKDLGDDGSDKGRIIGKRGSAFHSVSSLSRDMSSPSPGMDNMGRLEELLQNHLNISATDDGSKIRIFLEPKKASDLHARENMLSFKMTLVNMLSLNTKEGMNTHNHTLSIDGTPNPNINRLSIPNDDKNKENIGRLEGFLKMKNILIKEVSAFESTPQVTSTTRPHSPPPFDLASPDKKDSDKKKQPSPTIKPSASSPALSSLVKNKERYD